MQNEKFILIKNIHGETRAYLTPEADGIKDCYIDRHLNAEEKLEFLLPLQSKKWFEITPECRFVVDGREFTILKPDAMDIERSQDGKTWGKVMAEGSWALLDKKFITISNDPQSPEPSDLQVAIISGGASTGGYSRGSAGSALTYLLQGQDEWELGTVDVEGTHDLETEKISLLQNIKKVQEIWGGVLVWEYVSNDEGNIIKRKLHLRDETKWQDYKGFEVRYAKNLKSITRTANHDIVTKLYPFGENDLDIASVNDGKKHITNFSYTDKEYTGLLIKQEIEDPQTLKEKAEEALAKLCKPRYTYRTGLVDLRTLPEFSHEEFTLGDIVKVTDPEVGTEKARLQRHKYNVFQPWICELEIGEPEERLVAQLKNSIDMSHYIKDILRPNPTVGNMLKGFVNTATTVINGAKGDYTVVDGVSTWWNRNEQGVRTGEIVRISPKGVLISEDGGQTSQLAITGAGVAAETVMGVLGAFAKVRANQIIVGDEGEKIPSKLLDIDISSELDGLRDELRLVSPLPTSISLDSHGIRASTTTSNKYAQMDHRGLYISNGALQIDGASGKTNYITGEYIDLGNAGLSNTGTTDNDIRFWAGKSYANRTTAPFRINQKGQLTATQANISGVVNASDFKINGRSILTNNKINASAIEDLVVGGNVMMGPNAIISWGNVSNKPYDLAYISDIPTLP
ncbi:MAG TPA: hypothetical protein GX529_10335, partial [Firmicutes bacterium]|nr:hypothetical protein [Candidatus Fermentithermobacillaceae bacterium]